GARQALQRLGHGLGVSVKLALPVEHATEPLGNLGHEFDVGFDHSLLLRGIVIRTSGGGGSGRGLESTLVVCGFLVGSSMGVSGTLCPVSQGTICPVSWTLCPVS